MSTVNSLLEGASPYKALQNEAGKLAGKWSRSGLLEGISSSTKSAKLSGADLAKRLGTNKK